MAKKKNYFVVKTGDSNPMVLPKYFLTKLGALAWIDNQDGGAWLIDEIYIEEKDAIAMMQLRKAEKAE